MAFSALESFGALIPTDSFGKHLAVLRRVLEYFWWPPEVPHVVRIDTTFAVMTIFFGWAPGRLVHEHIEYETVLLQIQTLQIEVQIGAQEQTLRHKVVLDAFVLEVQIDISDCLQVSKPET